jgi:hypothetical protein
LLLAIGFWLLANTALHDQAALPKAKGQQLTANRHVLMKE